MSYINSKNLDDYYVDLYKELALSQEASIENDKKEIEDAVNELSNIFNIQNQIITFLAENKGKWEIDEDGIVFNSQNLEDQYNQYIQQI